MIIGCCLGLELYVAEEMLNDDKHLKLECYNWLNICRDKDCH